MKTHILQLVLLIFGLSLYQNSRAQCTVQVNGSQVVCATAGAFQYTAGSHSGSFTSWSIDPAGSATIGFSDAGKAFVTFNNSFAGCAQSVSVKYNYILNGIPRTCSTNVWVHKDVSAGLTSITGPSFVAPAVGWINSLPTVSYSVPLLGCGSYQWSAPNGWVISGQGSNAINITPEITSECSGNVSVKWSNGICEKTLVLPVSRASLTNGTLNSFCKSVDSWTNLMICEGDELYIDGSTSSFCASSTNIFVSVTPCDATFNPISPELPQWLSQPQYDALGGLARLDMNMFMNTFFSPTSFTPGNYKIKLAVSGGTTWNERTFTLIVNPRTPVPSGNFHLIVPQPTPNPDYKTVDLVWSGNTNDLYEVIYEYADAPTFPHPGTTRPCPPVLACGTAAAYSIPGTVHVTVTIPICNFLRFRVRKCACEEWYGSPNNQWVVSNGPLCKRSSSTGLVEELYAENGISIYPNPTPGLTTLSFDKPLNQKLNMEVYDIQGKKVLWRDLGEISTGKYEVDMSALTNGLYVIKVLNHAGEIRYMSKLVKE